MTCGSVVEPVSKPDECQVPAKVDPPRINPGQGPENACVIGVTQHQSQVIGKAAIDGRLD